jgi:hypothetical protein
MLLGEASARKSSRPSRIMGSKLLKAPEAPSRGRESALRSLYSPQEAKPSLRSQRLAPLWKFSIAKAMHCYQMAKLEAASELLERRLLFPLAL